MSPLTRLLQVSQLAIRRSRSAAAMVDADLRLYRDTDRRSNNAKCRRPNEATRCDGRGVLGPLSIARSGGAQRVEGWRADHAQGLFTPFPAPLAMNMGGGMSIVPSGVCWGGGLAKGPHRWLG